MTHRRNVRAPAPKPPKPPKSNPRPTLTQRVADAEKHLARVAFMIDGMHSYIEGQKRLTNNPGQIVRVTGTINKGEKAAIATFLKMLNAGRVRIV